MFASFLQLISQRISSRDHDEQFVVDVHVPPPREPRSLKSEHRIIAGWILIIAKCVIVWWLIAKYHVPFHPLWLVGPTVMFGLLATAAYIWRD